MGTEPTRSCETGAASGIDPLALLDGVPGIIVVVDAAGQVRWVNEAITDVTGFTTDEVIGSNMLDHVDLEWNPLALESITYALENPGMRLPTMLRFHTKFGSPIVMETTANNQLDNPLVEGLIVHLRPADERQLLDMILESFTAGESLDATMGRVHQVARAETLQSDSAIVLRLDERDRAQPVLASTPAVSLLSSVEGLETPWTQAAAYGRPVVYEDLDRLAPSLRSIAMANGYQACWSYPMRHSCAEAVAAVLVLWRSEVGPPEPTATMMAERIVRLCELILERMEHSRELQHAAEHDHLTGLVNRATFFRTLEAHLEQPDAPVGVLYLDLDGFKPINDKWGHLHGDQVLMAVAERLRISVRSVDVVGRLGGDEFAIACPGANEADLIRLAERLLSVIRAPITAVDAIVRVGTSVGLAVCPQLGCTAEELVAAADGALIAAKAEAKGTWRAASLSR